MFFRLLFLLICGTIFLQADPLTKEQGDEYVQVLCFKYRWLWPYRDRCRDGDAVFGNKTYGYGDLGSFSPIALRYFKIAGDLKSEYGPLTNMNIVEYGGDGQLCKIVAEICGFKSYTLINSREVNERARAFLSSVGVNNVYYIDSSQVDRPDRFDLFISNFALSNLPREMQGDMWKRLIGHIPRGYISGSFNPNSNSSFTVYEWVKSIYAKGAKGRVDSETFMSMPGRGSLDPNKLAICWRPVGEFRPSTLKGKGFLVPGCSAITFHGGGGRTGDWILAYFHAKWLAMETGLPFVYRGFSQSNLFRMHDMDNCAFNFSSRCGYDRNRILSNTITSTLYEVPYFSECWWEPGPSHLFSVDWEDPVFLQEARECLTPRSPVEPLPLPKDRITVAVHVRRGGGYDGQGVKVGLPLKFPPDSFYIEQIRKIAEFYSHHRLYVYIFTDDQNPQGIRDYYEKEIQNPNIVFDSRKNNQHGEFLKDFISMGKFDCLIGCSSNYSLMAALLADYALMIIPTHSYWQANEKVVDQIEIKFKAKNHFSSELTHS